MGTLYDLLGALPSDDAEGLRTAFRKAAKATHPDINPDNPDAALRFRELVRAYDILTDADQRATYDELLAIALQPPPATQMQATRTYEAVGKYASNTMAATIISAVLVGGYTVFGLFSKPPSAAEIEAENIPGATLQAFAAALPVLPNPAETRVQREGKASTDEAAATPAVAPATKEAAAASDRPFRETRSRVRLLQSGGSILSALRDRLFRSRHRAAQRRRARSSIDRHVPGQARRGSEEDEECRTGAAQAAVDRAASRFCTCYRTGAPRSPRP